MERIVVVGAGLAGARAANQLRKEGFDGTLTVIGDEAHKPYTRPPLSKQLLAGEQSPEDVLIKTELLEDADYELDTEAVGLDTARKVVVVAGGDEVPYDGLVIATGRRAREAPDGGLVLRTLDDAIRLSEAAAEHERVVIVGAGFVGCEVAATLVTRGAQVTLLDIAPLPLAPIGPEAGERIAAIHREHGVDLRLDIAPGDVPAGDVILYALGSVPNTEWVKDSGLQLDRGGAIVADASCLAVGADGVAVAGDCAAWPHPRAAGDTVSVEHWTHASDMGRAAAKNLLGAGEPFTAVPTFWSDQYDVNIKSAGFPHQADERRVVHDEDGQLVVEGYRDGTLVGVVVFNMNRTWLDYRRQLSQPV